MIGKVRAGVCLLAGGMNSIKRYITKRNMWLAMLFVFLIQQVITRPQIIPIPGGQTYSYGEYQEYFVVINPPIAPWKTVYLKRLIEKYDKEHPIETLILPENRDYVWGYTRQFFRESKTFPRDIVFTADLGASDILTEEYNLRDRIGYISARSDQIHYNVRIRFGDEYGSFWDITRDYEEPNVDPTLNGLYLNVLEHKKR